jgi:hypothetical protein
VDSSRSHDPRLYRAPQPSSTYPYENGQQPPKRTSSSPQPQGPSATYPYDPVPRQPQQQQPQPPQQRWVPPQPQPQRRNQAPRRFLGVLAFLALTGLSLPVHIGAIFFIYVEFESPGDPAMAALLIGGAFIGSFVALFLTGLIAQKVGGFPGRWRARVTFAVLSAIIGLGVAYFAALNLF